VSQVVEKLILGLHAKKYQINRTMASCVVAHPTSFFGWAMAHLAYPNSAPMHHGPHLCAAYRSPLIDCHVVLDI